MRVTLSLCLLQWLLCQSRVAIAQSHDAHWIFGDGYHIEFVEEGPLVHPFIEGYYAFEGASCISNKSGNLLFYCNTQQVWNRAFELLENGDSINSRIYSEGSSITNGSIFLPFPGDTLDRFYTLFVIDEISHQLFYSVIDSWLAIGLGGIDSNHKNSLVFPRSVGEKLSAIKHANGRDWWILGNAGYPLSDTLFIHLFQNSGITKSYYYPSVLSSSYIGEMAVTMNGDYFAYVSQQETGPSYVCLYDFDRCSGQIHFIDTVSAKSGTNEFYGLEFANNSKILYVSTERNHSLFQFDFTSGEILDTLIFRVKGPAFTTFDNRGGQLEMGPDGKIYMVMMRVSENPLNSVPIYDEYLAAVTYPDLQGTACEFDTFAVYLNGRMNRTYSLPNFANYDLGPLVGSPCDTLSPQDTTQTGIPSAQIPALPFSISPTIGNGWFIMEGPQSGWAIVYDLYGREIDREWHEERTAFDLTNQPAGVYLVVLRTDDGNQSLPQKIIRQ
jgi:hypothetical protein